MGNDQYNQQIIELIATNYGHEVEDMSPDWDLMEDVGLFNSSFNNADDDTRFVMLLNHTYDLDLQVQDISSAVKRGEISTIEDLANYVADEVLSI